LALGYRLKRPLGKWYFFSSVNILAFGFLFGIKIRIGKFRRNGGLGESDFIYLDDRIAGIAAVVDCRCLWDGDFSSTDRYKCNEV
jgi:hypothetical protein